MLDVDIVPYKWGNTNNMTKKRFIKKSNHKSPYLAFRSTEIKGHLVGWTLESLFVIEVSKG